MTDPRKFRIKPVAVLLAATYWASASHAASNIARDGSLGAGPTAALSATGIVVKNGFPFQTIAIPESYGQRAGTNVFHSFSAFSVGLGDGAVFTVNQNTGNVISRVTGGQASAINGLLSLDPTNSATAPNFFLVNPAGITFGAGAVVDVPAAFHVGTANYLKFPDGNFYADPAAASTFSTAAPEAFGFLGTTRATVSVGGGAVLMPQAAQPLSVIGGDVTLDNGWVVTQEGGDVRVVALGQRTQEVGFSGALPAAYGNLTVTNGGYISTSTSAAAQAGNVYVGGGTLLVTEGAQIGSVTAASGDAGSVTIAAGRMTVSGSSPSGGVSAVGSSTTAAGKAGIVDITVAEDLSVAAHGFIHSATWGSGDAGQVTIRSGSLALTDGTSIYTAANTGSTGNAGRVDISTAGALIMSGGSGILSSTAASGAAGSVTIDAGSVMIDGAGGVQTGISSATSGGGNAGSIQLTVANGLTILNGAGLASDTSGGGNAGLVAVSAGSIAIDGNGTPTGINSDANFGSGGHAGPITVTASGGIALTNGGGITSSTYGPGNAGTVAVNAGSLAIDSRNGIMTGAASLAHAGSTGKAGVIDVTVAGALTLTGSLGGITTSTMSTSVAGDAGTITVTAGNVRALDNAEISSDTYGPGKAGSVSVTANAGSIAVDGAAKIGAAAAAGSSGQTGNVTVTATESVTVSNGAEISIRNDGTAADPTALAATTLKVIAPAITVDGGTVTAETGGNVAAGTIEITASGTLEVLSGAQIDSSTHGGGDAGSVTIAANRMTVSGSSPSGGISAVGSSTTAAGKAGVVDIAVAEDLNVAEYGFIHSATWGSGDAGQVTIRPGSLALTDGASIYTAANTGSTGNAGRVDIATAGALTLSGSQITSSTHASGRAGSVTIDAGSLTLDGTGAALGSTGITSSTFGTGDAGSVRVTVANDLLLRSGGGLASDTWDTGNAGAVTVNAGSVTLEGSGTEISSDAKQALTGNAGTVSVTSTGDIRLSDGGKISSLTDGAGHAGSVLIQAGGMLEVLSGAQIDSSTHGGGDAGSVTISANRMAVSGSSADGGVSAVGSSTTAAGAAGVVDITVANDLSLSSGALIHSKTHGAGDAGSVTINAGSVTIDGTGDVQTGISSATSGGGNAGSVHLTVANGLTMLNGAGLASDTSGGGNAGLVTVNAGSIAIDGNGTPTGINSDANIGSGGHAGPIDVTASGGITLTDGGGITSSTYGPGNAGTVAVNAGSLAIDSRNGIMTGAASLAGAGSTGKAGVVNVTVAGALTLTGNLGGITTSTTSAAAGGDAGTITVTAGSLAMTDQAQISSDTYGSGKAGSVAVAAADSLRVDGAAKIAAGAAAGSSGQTGNVDVTAGKSIALSNGGKLAVKNEATVADPAVLVPTLLKASAPTITLKDAEITAASTGNVAASGILVSFVDKLYADPSAITTSSNLGNGGPITIAGSGTLVLENSRITTSVAGLTGNGGDINIAANTLLLRTGFIQANTAASNATGGNVAIDVRLLVPTGNTLFLGGSTAYAPQAGVFGFNVIQAAAPTGVSGTVQTTAPSLDVSGTLVGLSAKLIDTGGLGRSLCQIGGGSSMVQAGRGGFAPSARDLFGPAPAAAPFKAAVAVPYGLQLASTGKGCAI